ncbi:MAG: glutamate 5-kinase [Firmicutes bacterium]|nr:glutamate 5-kinase [Bacillota bacterium]
MKKLTESKRVVVKVGTSTLTYPSGRLNLRRIDKLAMTLCDLANQGREIVLVSSGAIGVAVGKLGLPERPKDTVTNQAIAAVGQCELMMMYDRLFGNYNRTVAQILVTGDDISIEKREENMKNTFNRLLEMNIIPIVNENDTVSFDEIEIGDNDTLSAEVAKLINADLLVLFSDIDGLYDDDPHKNPNAKLLRVVDDITPIKYMASDSATKQGTGGMVTKLNAAEIATESGINMVIANGDNIDALYDILEGKVDGTLFTAK